ncbi:hypothetical protein N8640_04430, partial [Akkermansiaceae bacterium]|nr:hypothetical protein [Akkermansiaceae bacterium]
ANDGQLVGEAAVASTGRPVVDLAGLQPEFRPLVAGHHLLPVGPGDYREDRVPKSDRDRLIRGIDQITSGDHAGLYYGGIGREDFIRVFSIVLAAIFFSVGFVRA